MKKVTVEQWKELFRDIGMTDADMLKWHSGFETKYPEGHQGFLEWLGLEQSRIGEIRQKSR